MSSRREFLKQTAAVAVASGAGRSGAARATPVKAKSPEKSGVFHPIELASVTLAGEFGRRVDRMIEANVLQIDIDDTFLTKFRTRGQGGYVGVGKFIDAMVRFAVGTGDPRVLQMKKSVVGKVLATQDPDGYIGTVADPKSRIRAIWDLHEMSYLLWGLISDYQLLGEKNSLKSARRLADYILGLFAADPNVRPEVPAAWRSLMPAEMFPFDVTKLGLESSMLALTRATGDKKYRDFVVHFLKLNEYDRPIQTGTSTTANHAYTHIGNCMAQLELYRETGSPHLLEPARKTIEFLRHGDGMLVTGSCSHWECWHDTQSGLENTSETCASAYVARLMEAMMQLEGDSIYGDIMERDIYNALFAATSSDGRLARYHTPFDGKRLFDPKGNRYCCANNNKRFLADLKSWMYYRTDSGVAVNLYNASTATVPVAKGVTLKIEQQTDYPSSGNVRLKVDPSRSAQFDVQLRIPRWCKAATVSVNGAKPETVAGGQFYRLTREWQRGDVIELDMPMEWRFIRGRRSQDGRAAILRGPVIFTFNPERNAEVNAIPEFEPRLLKLNPLETEPPVRDDSVRPGGVQCRTKAWPQGPDNPYLVVNRVPLVLTEYPDEGGRSIYFMVPGLGQSQLVDDELI